MACKPQLTVRLMTKSELEVFEAQIKEYHDRPMEFIPRTPFGATYGGVDLTDRIAIETSNAKCGNHYAETCADCPFSGTKNHGAGWCNGDCFWNSESSVCQDTDPNPNPAACAPEDEVRCGSHTACSCAECPFSGTKNHGAGWCHGACWWNDATSTCEVPPGKDCGGGVFAEGKAYISICCCSM